MATDPRFSNTRSEVEKGRQNTDPRYRAALRAPKAGYASKAPQAVDRPGRAEADLAKRHELFGLQDDRMQYRHPVVLETTPRARRA